MKKLADFQIYISVLLKQERGLFLFLGLGNRKLILISRLSGYVGETVSWKMKNVSYLPNHDTLIRNLTETTKMEV